MNLMLAGMGIQFLGGIFGGKKRKKTADKMYHETMKYASQGINARKADDAENVRRTAADEARAAANQRSGYDLASLRDEAIKAGFNPLTVLNATGGAGYARQDLPTMTTPFISTADDYMQKAGMVAGAGQAAVETSGYFGDALAALGKGITDMGALTSQQAHERALQATKTVTKVAQRTGFAPSKQITASPVKNVPGAALSSIFGPDSMVPVYEIDGTTSFLSARNMDALGKRPFDVMMTQDWTNVLGETADIGGAIRSPKVIQGTSPASWQFTWNDAIQGWKESIGSPFDYLPSMTSGGWSDRKPGNSPPLRINIGN